MRTVLIVSSYPLPKCGISRYTGSIIEVFDIKSIKIKTHTIHFTKKPFSYFISSYQLIYILLFSKLDTIHFQYTPTILGPLAPIFIVIARWKRVKVITTVHESLESYNEYLFFPLNYLFVIYNNVILNFSDILITLTNNQSRKFTSEQKNKTQVIPIGITSNQYTKDKNIEDKYAYLNNFSLIGFFGFIRRGKGLETLIDAFKEIVGKKDRVALLIAGKPQDQNYIKSIVKLIDVKNVPNVFILDYLEKDEMTYLMHKVECIILPYKKNTNSAILSDAISVETPVVGSKVGAIKEYITNYRIGELFESENIKELSQKILFVMNGSKKHEYTSNIRQLKKRFNWKIISNMHIQLYS